MHATAHFSGDTPSPGQARTLWPAFETIHATVYFAPEGPEAYRALGLKGGWMGYFATRSAALAGAPWDHLGSERTTQLLELLTPLAWTIAERGGVPVPNPVGVPAP